jgi:transposase
MMGRKARERTARHTVSLEDLVPADDVYRHLDRILDLAFVRDLVRDRYAVAGRPSIDPVVFFRLQLILFFEGLRSERQLLRVVADRLSLRWYLGYDLGERLPDHSSLTRIRDRYGLEVFRRFFEAIVEQCQAAGLVWGKELYIDGTKVEANAALDSLRPRFYVEAHLRRLFREAAAPPADEGAPVPAPVAPPGTLPTAPPADLAAANARRHDWLAEGGRPDRQPTVGRVRRRSERRADWEASTTDPDATAMDPTGGGRLGYKTHYVVDGGRARVIVAALVTPGDPRRGAGQPAGGGPAVVRPLPLGPAPPPGHGRHALRHRRAHRGAGGRGHPRLRAPARLGPAHRPLRRLALPLRPRARHLPLPAGAPTAAPPRLQPHPGLDLPR